MLQLLAWGRDGWGDEFVLATLMTVAVALASYAIGTAIGLAGAAAKLSGIAPLDWLATGYTTVVRGVPDLLIIYLFFFGGSGALMAVARVFGHAGYIEVPAFMTGCIAVGCVCGAYATEVIRGAIAAVPRGQIEAARACGMSRGLLFRRVVAPQALRLALPGLGNVWQVTLKETALISVAGLVEILRQAQVAAGSTRQPFTFYFLAALLYLGLTTLSGAGFRAAERVVGRGAVGGVGR